MMVSMAKSCMIRSVLFEMLHEKQYGRGSDMFF